MIYSYQNGETEVYSETQKTMKQRIFQRLIYAIEEIGVDEPSVQKLNNAKHLLVYCSARIGYLISELEKNENTR